MDTFDPEISQRLCLEFPYLLNSRQAKKSKREAVEAELIKLSEGFGYYLTDDVAVRIQLLINEERRYESDESPDIDNVLKPALDCLSGVNRILIDDNQVQFISCQWIDTLGPEKCLIEIELPSGSAIKKSDIVFIHLGNQRYLPLGAKGWPKSAHNILGEHLQRLIRNRDLLEKEGFQYHHIKPLMPIQRVFHRTRISGFEMMEIEDLLKL